MEFNSFAFIVFWLILSISYVVFGSIKTIGFQIFRKLILLSASLIFIWNITSFGLLILLLGGIFDFYLGISVHHLQKESYKKWLMRISVLWNVSLILFFNHITDWFSLNNLESSVHLPFIFRVVGVSFFAFRSMSYVMDVYYENLDKPEKNILNYLNYVLFFPLYLSGPIQEYESFQKNINTGIISINHKQIGRATLLISLGIIKKYILGNYLALNFVNRVFESSDFFSSLELFIASIAQTFTLYLDFSGYTDIVIGLALLLGFELSENFNFPFLAQNVTEYWKRWHITLSQWFNKYVYFPMSYYLRRWKKWGTSISVFVVFLISGFWHGTQPNYWIWGIMHAICMVWDVFTSNMRSKWKKHTPHWIYKPISILLTFGFLTYSGIFFKAKSILHGQSIVLKIIDGIEWELFEDWLDLYPWVAIILLVLIIVQFTFSGIYKSIVKIYEQTPILFLSIQLIIVVFIAYQFDKMGSLPFYYLQF